MHFLRSEIPIPEILTFLILSQMLLSSFPFLISLSDSNFIKTLQLNCKKRSIVCKQKKINFLIFFHLFSMGYCVFWVDRMSIIFGSFNDQLLVCGGLMAALLSPLTMIRATTPYY